MDLTKFQQDDPSTSMHKKSYEQSNSSLDLFDISDDDSVESSIRTMCKPTNKFQKSRVLKKNKTYGRSRPQCTDADAERENNVSDRVPSRSKVTKSESANFGKKKGNFNNSFGAGIPRRKFAKRRPTSPLDKPMILSRRMSYKITNPALSPLSSPITAVKLTFSPHVNMSAEPGNKRPSNQGHANDTAPNGPTAKEGKKVSKLNRRRTT
ncbi:hypothetical protein ACHAXS_004895 [Conticribra weissflogii]